jgi:hypothetical protein
MAIASEIEIGSPTKPLKFERLMVMMFENHGYTQCMTNSYWKQFSTQGLMLSNYYAITHPSQPNYIAQIGGDTLGCTGDSPIDIPARNLIDIIDEHGLTWKSYQEDYVPLAKGDCQTVSKADKYYRKHNPHMSFTSISKNLTRCQHIVPSTQLDSDISAGKLSNFMYFTPNIDNDAHDTDLNFGGKWLQAWLDKYMKNSKFTNGTLLMITFDEDEHLEGNHVFALLLGPYVTPKTSEGGAYTHYSLTRTIELNWGLPDLGRHDKTASDFIHAIKNAQPITDEEIEREINAKWASGRVRS